MSQTITDEEFEQAKVHDILATGTGIYPCLQPFAIRWVAVKGDNNDWAMYYHYVTWTVAHVCTNGDKVFTDCIKDIVIVSEEMLKNYRR